MGPAILTRIWSIEAKEEPRCCFLWLLAHRKGPTARPSPCFLLGNINLSSWWTAIAATTLESVSHAEGICTYVNLFILRSTFSLNFKTPPPDHILPFLLQQGRLLADIALWNPYVYYRRYLVVIPVARKKNPKMLPGTDFIPFSSHFHLQSYLTEDFLIFVTSGTVAQCKQQTQKVSNDLGCENAWILKGKCVICEAVWTKLELAGPFLSASSL